MPVLCAALICAALPARADFTQQGAKLVGDLSSFFGNAVALSADGNTALVGERLYNSGAGAAVVFVRTNGVWTVQTGLLANNALGNANQGYAVALSADGNTALVGGSADNGDQGAAWIFTRSGSSWSQQAKLFGTGAVGAARQGRSVALSADGNTAIMGGVSDNSEAGAAWVFTRSGGGWSQQGPKLVGDPGSLFGWSVALSADGNTALVGEPTYNSSKGAAVVFIRVGGVWSVESGLLGSGAAGNAGLGESVALSADGNTALVGGYNDNGSAGATWVFTRTLEDGWTQQGTKLVGTGATGTAAQGGHVALSADGNIALIGGSSDNADTGATWVFSRSGTAWSQRGSKLVGVGPTGVAGQGGSVALSGDGYTALIGGPRDNANSGAAWVFIRSRPNTHDFNGDLKSDILWRHSSGQVAMWLMNGVSVLQGPGVGSASADWQIAGQRDFNGDGRHDILWRNINSGQLILWLMNGAAVTQAASVGSATTDWQIVGTGDFNADGKADILWRNTNSGQIIVWLMNGAAVAQSSGVGSASSDWQVVSVGDFNGDGKADILWRHTGGSVLAWLMNGATVTQPWLVGSATSDWQIVGTGDFNGDDKADILWRHSSGAVAAWLLNGVSVTQSANIGSATADWSIAETGDLDGDGKSDILWRHSGGSVAAWLLNGVTVTQSAGVGAASTDWVIQATNAN